jgi:hypothetical protein
LCDWHCTTFFVLLLETKAKQSNAMQFMLFLHHVYGVIVVSLISIFHYPTTTEAYIILASSATSSLSPSSSSSSSLRQQEQQKTTDNKLNSCWTNAKISLRRNDCCVVTVSDDPDESDSRRGQQQERLQLQDHLQILQNEIADNNNKNGGPNDTDLRARISIDTMNYDCLKVCNSIFDDSYNNGDNNDNSNNDRILRNNRCIAALEELAVGMLSLAEHDDGVVNAVYVRIVCASKYNAIDPMYHTDKAPLRGYVTLRGIGTEYMTRTCTSPIEYLSLRTFGKLLPSPLSLSSPLSSKSLSPLRCAQELEFIVMKGDYYKSSSTSTIWQRASACVHRSPPGGTGRSISKRRVIISFDLADGDDNREWYQVDKQRQWRSGMTQRKSHLVA